MGKAQLVLQHATSQRRLNFGGVGMGVCIGYRPHKPNQLKYVQGGSSLQSALENAFTLPCVLSDTHIQTLRGIAACGHKGAGELIDAICEFGAIEVKAEY